MMQWLIRRQALHAERFGRDADQVPLIIRCIAVGKHGKSQRFLMGALLVKRLMHVPDLAATLSDPLIRVHIDPDGARAQRLLALSTGIPLDRLILVAGGMWTYAVVYLIEGCGLWFDRPWAEWLTVVATGCFIPLEVHHLWHGPSLGITTTLLINLTVVGYLAWRIHRRLRAGRYAP